MDARGDELPPELSTRHGRQPWLRDAKRRLDAAVRRRQGGSARAERLKDAKRRLDEELDVAVGVRVSERFKAEACTRTVAVDVVSPAVSRRSESLSDSDRETLERIAALQDQDTIERALAAARQRLGMDAAYVTAIDSGTRRVTNFSGDMEALGVTPGKEVPIEQTYCGRMLSGEIPNIVPDTSAEPAVQGLPATARVKAYVGVPIELADGSVHGSLCCGSSLPRTELGQQELKFMQVLAGMVATRIEQARSERSPS